MIGGGQAAAQNADSLKAAQRHKLDSLNLIRGYKQSKHYQDSVEYARIRRVDSMKAERQRVNDSLTAARKRVSDSIIAERRRHMDSVRAYNDSIRMEQQRQLELVKAAQKRVSDSLANVRKYRESKHYKDSIANSRKAAKDSMSAARKHLQDSLMTARTAIKDSTIAARKAYNDSLKTSLETLRAERMRELDSLADVRKVRSDSLSKIREERAALRKTKQEEREKERAEKKSLSLELKIKKKQESYSNEDLRKKKWTLLRKVTQNTFTRYNYYFNADRKMDEAIENMVRSHNDNYDSLIALFPFDPDRDSAKLSNDMDTIIRKSSLGIQIHDPRAKWQDDLYLLVGQAYYYKGDYANAGSAFKHIITQAEADKKERDKKAGKTSKQDKNKPVSYSEEEKSGLAGAIAHKSAKNEAMLWLSRTLTQAKNEGQAQTLLDMLRNDVAFPDRLTGRLALEQSFIDLYRNDDIRATQSLGIVSTDNKLPKWLRQRANYLNGQLLQQQGNYEASSQHFEKVVALNPNLDMDFYARKNIAVNSINQGSGTVDAAEMLLAMSKDGKYRPYYDQVYYALGKVAYNQANSDKAIDYYKQSIALSQNNRKQKGLSFVALGEEYYKRSQYNLAKSAYDSATLFLTAADGIAYTESYQRSQSLDHIAAPGNEVRQQDSLLLLASLSEREQRAIIKKYIRDLERQLADSAYQAQHGQGSNTSGDLKNNNAQTWYFANPTLMKKGENDFKHKWGNRSLKDNWRRSMTSGDTFDQDQEESGTEETITSNLPNEDSLLAAIPRTPQELDNVKQQLSEGLFLLGKGYYTHLEDYEAAGRTFDTLDKRFPEHPHGAEVLYTRYLMAMRQNQPAAAQQYLALLQSRYGDSEWAKLLEGATAQQAENKELYASASSSSGSEVSRHYDETYELLAQRQYSDVLRRVAEADELYKQQGDFKKRYALIKAVAIAGVGNYPEADTLLTQFNAQYAGDSLTDWANTVLEYIRKQKVTLVPPAFDTLPADSLDQAYQYTPTALHYVVFAAVQDARLAGFKSGLSDFNLMKEGYNELSVTMTTLEVSRSLVICKEFPNAAAAKKYMNEIRALKQLFREYSNSSEYDLLLISAGNYPKLLFQKDYTVYKTFYNKNYK